MREGYLPAVGVVEISSDANKPAVVLFLFFFNDTATTEIYTLSLHDALPISCRPASRRPDRPCPAGGPRPRPDRKSTRLNSSHTIISYAVFCLKKKTTHSHYPTPSARLSAVDTQPPTRPPH